MTETTVEANSLRTRRRRLVKLIAATAGLIGVIAVVGLSAGLRINLTPSQPIGLWRILPLKRPASVGDIVFICPPRTVAMEDARERGYLRRGLCPGGYAPLIKTIVATAGQRIEVGKALRINNEVLPQSELSSRDGQGRVMKPFPGGIVPAGEVFLHSNFKGSFDSRYFGPVPASGILGYAQQVLTYAP